MKREKIELSSNFTVTAHAGAMRTKANTISSVEKILETKADIVEFDVSFRPDGTPVTIHKDNPSQTQGELFENMLEAVAKSNKLKINLDLKSEKNLPAIEELVKRVGLLDRVFFTGVDEKRCKTVKENCPNIPYFLNASLEGKQNNEDFLRGMCDKIISLGAVGINMHYINASAAACRIMHEKNLLVSVWTVQLASDMRRLLSYGVDNITTKKPNVLLRIISI